MVGQQHAVVWDQPVIQSILLKFLDGAVYCCCFLEQALYPHYSSQPSCIIGECEATSSCASLSKKLPSHCSCLPSCNGYLAVLALAGKGKSWTRMKTYFKYMLLSRVKLTIALCTFTWYMCDINCVTYVSSLYVTMVQITHNLNGLHVSHTCDTRVTRMEWTTHTWVF